jgi:RNA polymerase sigma factor (sigma-70 family)
VSEIATSRLAGVPSGTSQFASPRPARLEPHGRADVVEESVVRLRAHPGSASQDAVPPGRGDERVLAFGATLTLVVESEALVQRCQAGDDEAFRQLFRAHRTDVTRLVHRLLGGSADVEDVVQEVFLQVHRSLKDFRFGSRFSTWLYRVTVNVVLMQRRAARSRPIFVEALDTPSPRDEALLPDEQAARGRRVEALFRILARLSDKKRVVFVLHELEGLSPTEIAKIVRAPVLTVRTRLFYARRELVELLREEPALARLADEVDASAGVPSGDPQKEPA